MSARVKIIRSSDLGRCPKHSLLPAHYRDDGTCRCDEREAATAAFEQAKIDLATARRRVDEAREWRETT